ncbi:glycosyltransferase family 4 protein [Paenibacillus sp. ATY16]|uniref:glycosyltransferase family 4 protein n=1 Tax=Paenibacillus sp. ATY16 TaxID=1759312 RepID=UPI000E2EA4CE|nr:glycosyltransferase family 4 protein [Paenibacillus sp. ATY16]MCK9859382.1 glycosyltransferase family 4 protein [Paenibacillus sp. ATY16]
MSPVKVAFVTPGAYPIPSGNSSSVERVVEKFVPLLRPSVEPRIYGKTGRNLPRRSLVHDVVCERFHAARRSAYVANIGRAIKKFGPQIIQVENRPTYVIKLRHSNPKTKIWLNLHSSTYISPRHISETQLRKSFALADRIIVNSEFLRGLILKKVPEASAKLRVVYPGVETRRFQSRYTAEGEAARRHHRERKGLVHRKVVVFLGRLIPLKGVHHLLAIVPKLIKIHPDLLVVIVGSPFYGSHRTTAYSRKLLKMGERYKKHVRFVPYVPYSEVPGWFMAADIAVMPSGKREAFGLVNVEAMATGLPVIATRAGGMQEIIQDGETGFLINQTEIKTELTAKLLLLLHNAALRRQMGVKSRQRVEQLFTWEHTAKRWLKIQRNEADLKYSDNPELSDENLDPESVPQLVQEKAHEEEQIISYEMGYLNHTPYTREDGS